MQRGKHAKRRSRRWPIVAVAVVAFLAALGGGTVYAAYRYDLARSDRILPGVLVAGVDVGGMTPGEAASAVAEALRPQLDAQITLEAAGETWSATAEELGLRASIAPSVDRALAAGDPLSFIERAYRRFTDRPLGESFDVEFRVKPSPIRSFAMEVADQVARPARNAAVLLDGDRVVMRDPKDGLALEVDRAVERIQGAVMARLPSVHLPTEPVRPKVGVRDLGYTLVVDRAANELYVYRGFKLAKTYPVATGTPEYETPAGEWTIIDKVVNPTWVNPAPDGWGASLPPVIPGGPGSPLGTRALYLDAPGIRIHGTYDVGSIGTAASHGCIRMLIEDVEEMYEYIPIGTRVLVL